MNVLAIIQVLFFFGYVAYLWNKFGVLHSISQSWYELKPFKKSHLFNVFAAGVGLPMWAYQIYMGSDVAQMLFAVSGFFMFGLGVASTFRDSKMVSTIHYLCTLFAIGFAFWGLNVQFKDGYFWYILGGTAVGCALLLLVKNKIWWIELLVFTVLILRLIIN